MLRTGTPLKSWNGGTRGQIRGLREPSRQGGDGTSLPELSDWRVPRLSPLVRTAVFYQLELSAKWRQVRSLARLGSGSARRSPQGSDGQRVELSLGLVFAKLVLHKCSQQAGNGRASDQIFALKEMCLLVIQSNLNRQLPGAAVCPSCKVAKLLSEGEGASGGRMARADGI